MQIAGESINMLLYFYKNVFLQKNFYTSIWNYFYVFFNNHVHYLLLNNVILFVNHLDILATIRHSSIHT